MVILHGWLNLRKGNKDVLSIIDKLIDSDGISISKAWMNGEVVYNLFVCHNHYGSSFDKLFKGVEKISKLESPDSYGLIYMLNDEDSTYFDEWQVWRLAKNNLEKVNNDKYLTPYSEKIAWYPDDCA